MNSLNTITVDDVCVEQFKALMKTTYRYTVYRIDVNVQPLSVQAERIGETCNTTHEDVAAELPVDECRFVFFNVTYIQGTGERVKTVMALWCPPDAPVKAKMIYAAAAGPLKSKLGTHVMGPLQASNGAEFEYGDVVLRCRKNFL